MKQIAMLLVCVLLMISCSKDDGMYIPEVFVNYHISLQEFQIKKNSAGVLIVNNEGVAGLIICRTIEGAYVAFDRCSSVNPEQECAVVPDDTGLIASDPCSGAKFSLQDGSPVKAPAKRPLKQYSVNVTNFEIAVVN